MKIQQFDGGLATRLAPQFISQNQGVEYTNIDSSTGDLRPVKTSLATAIYVDKYNAYFIKDDEWLSSATPTTFLEYQNVMYQADGVGRPTKRSSGVTQQLGIVAPQLAPTLTVSPKADPIEVFNIQNDLTQGDLPRGQLAYRLYAYAGIPALRAVPFEFILSATSDSNPGSTNVESAEVLEQINSVEPTQQVQVGYNPHGPVYQTVDTKPVGDARAVTISEILADFSGTYGGAELYRYYEGKWRLVGSLGFGTTSYTDATYDISGNVELDESLVTSFNGTYQYVYTYYNSTDGAESAPSPLTEELEVKSGKVNLSLAPSTDPQVTHIRVYRVGGERTLFAMVEEIDSAETSYTDELTDSEMDGRLLESENYYAAPEGLNFLSESYAMLFGAIDYTLYFTPIGVPNAWPPEYSIQFNAPITGIGPVANGVLVMTATQTFIVTGTGPLSLSMQLLRGDQGCVTHSSIQEVQQGAVVWASQDGLCSSSGSNVVSLTKDSLGDVKLDVVNSAVVDEVYYLQLTDGTTLVWDYRFTPIFKRLALGLESVTAANSEIYGWNAVGFYKLFQGSSNTELTYKSPRFVEGSLTEAKTYKKVYISYDGDIIIDIIIDDDLVTTKALSGKDTKVIQVPSAKQRGYYIQFKLTGTGLVNELEYRVSRRKDG